MIKIVKVEPLFVSRYLFVRITTDEGLTGIGESGAWGHLEASAVAISKFGDYLIGKDARQIEHHWNVMLRAHHFVGAAISGAVSAIDIALWDLKGKSLGVPIHELIGGAVRTKARLYAHVKGSTIEKQISLAKKFQRVGFTAVGHLNPLLDEDQEQPYFKAHARKIQDAVNNIRLMREAVGPDMDLCVEVHRRMTVPEAITLARDIEPYHPLFMEDPVPPANPDAMAWVADHIPIPIATGERFTSFHQFQTLLARRGVQFLRPCICICGGITGGRKIAALAEAYDAQVVPHNPLSPVSLAACLQLDAAIPNFAIQEYPSANPESEGHSDLRAANIVTGLDQPEDGFIKIPDSPGLGIQLVPGIEFKEPVAPRGIAMRPHFDGSVVDQ
ncbi:galactonate dehydratase [Phyllobacterium trifolii]|uniref:Galactonate dehydratase n=1 Tax=Phyllobacterium trifolii TaxID=300193 RepID=A0A839UDE3_9HYPH|nr:mandelate racemase/muconate lactonizing enzyme family protein [Phyllobacterium trifolii]MBB3146892.1 galactonate dehydratase [Phyllobacterium trifolii]